MDSKKQVQDIIDKLRDKGMFYKKEDAPKMLLKVDGIGRN